MSQAVIGREPDQAAIERFLDALGAASAGLVIAGEAGIGKTTLWQAALGAAGRLGYRVLVARPAESEARLSYSGLGDLLEPAADEVLPALPEPQRRALEVALLKAGDDGNPPDQRSVSVALLAVLRLLAATSPVVVAIDDVQWLDHPSARVLHFALRRLGPAPVGFVVARRVGPDLVDPLDLAQGVAGGRLWRIDVGPLSVAALTRWSTLSWERACPIRLWSGSIEPRGATRSTLSSWPGRFGAATPNWPLASLCPSPRICGPWSAPASRASPTMFAGR